MKPIKQTIHTATDGNCLAACLASIFENDIQQYPNLPQSKEWFPIINRYLQELGYNLICIDNLSTDFVDGYYLMIGFNSISEKKHCVICRNGEVVFDPSPERDENSPALTDVYYGILAKIIL